MGDVVQTLKYLVTETFYAVVKNKNINDYEPDSLRVMIAALDRHLNEKGYKFSIIRHREFHALFQASFRGESSAASPIRYGQTSK